MDVKRVAPATKTNIQRLDAKVLDSLARITHSKSGEPSVREQADVPATIGRVVNIEDVQATLAIHNEFSTYSVGVSARTRAGSAADIDR